MASLAWVNYHRARQGEPLLCVCGGDLGVRELAGGVFLCSACRTVDEHTRDSDCRVNPDTGLCFVCGASHGPFACHHCGGKAFHQPGCPLEDQ